MLKLYHTAGESGNANLASESPNTWFYQTFTPFENHDVSVITLKCWKTSDTTGTVTVSIRATDEDGKPTGNDLAYGILDVSGFSLSSPGTWQAFILNTVVSLTAFERYAIVIRGDLTPIYRAVYIRSSGSINYPFGWYEVSGDAGETWQDKQNNVDLLFKLYDNNTFISQLLIVAGNVSGGKHLWRVLDNGETLTVIDSWTLTGNVTAMAYCSKSRRLYVAIGNYVYCYNVDTMSLITSWGSSGFIDTGKTIKDIVVDSNGNLAVAN